MRTVTVEEDIMAAPTPRATTHISEMRLLGEKSQRLYFLASSAIDYIESDGNYVIIHEGAERYISRNTLKHLIAVLAPLGFMRIDRSLLINLRQVAFVERIPQCSAFAFTFRSGGQVVSGKSYRKAILLQLRRGMEFP